MAETNAQEIIRLEAELVTVRASIARNMDSASYGKADRQLNRTPLRELRVERDSIMKQLAKALTGGGITVVQVVPWS